VVGEAWAVAHAFVWIRTEGEEGTAVTLTDRVRALVEPPLAGQGFELVDVEMAGATLRVLVDRPGGIDLEAVAEATRTVSDVLDAEDPLPGRYTLEVSSPGVERPLRRPDHFRRFVGTPVSVKLKAGAADERRLEGTLEDADDDGFTVEGRRIPYGDLERARTVFVWEATPKKKKKKANR
jgi:ribosome maturation factor RimP